MATGVLCITSQLPLDASIWIRVTVKCGNQTITDWHFTKNISDDPCYDPAQLEYLATNTNAFVNTLKENSFSCYPNPVSNLLTLQFVVNNNISKVEIQLVDITGKLIKQLVNDKFQVGSYTKNIDISTMNSGYYIIKTKIGSELITKSIVKL